jgi:hypothetical protein
MARDQAHPRLRLSAVAALGVVLPGVGLVLAVVLAGRDAAPGRRWWLAVALLSVAALAAWAWASRLVDVSVVD